MLRVEEPTHRKRGWFRSHEKTEPSKGRPAGPGGLLFIITIVLSVLMTSLPGLRGSVSSHHFTGDFGTVKLSVEIGIQVVSLVGHQGAEWSIGRRNTAIAGVEVLTASDGRRDGLVGVARNACLHRRPVLPVGGCSTVA